MDSIKKLVDSYNGLCALASMTGGDTPEKIDFESIKNDKKKIEKVISNYESILDLKEFTSGLSVAPVYRNMVDDAKKELKMENHS